jgi:hypothetical protein
MTAPSTQDTLSAMRSVKCCCGQVIEGRTGEKLLAAVEAHIDWKHAHRENAQISPSTLVVQHEKTDGVKAEEDR